MPYKLCMNLAQISLNLYPNHAFNLESETTSIIDR
jgi:hypothetical protein